ncbi:hypothetical protein KIPE111705_31615 [Kibdelosporangium persicum]
MLLPESGESIVAAATSSSSLVLQGYCVESDPESRTARS